MKDPQPLHLTPPDQIRALGWQAESRDADGHLVRTHAPFDSDEDIVWFVRETHSAWRNRDHLAGRGGCEMTVISLAEYARDESLQALLRRYRDASCREVMEANRPRLLRVLEDVKPAVAKVLETEK